MVKDEVININGRLLSKAKTGLSTVNRGFRFGDSLFESIRVSNGRPLFLEDHFSRLHKGMKALKMMGPGPWNMNYFRGEILKVLSANQVDRGGRIRFTVFRTGSGLYTPSSNECGFVVETSLHPLNAFELNSEGLRIGIFDEWPLHFTKYSQYKTNNCLPYIMAGLWAREQGFDDVMMLNTQRNLCEASSSNIFIYLEGILYTAPLSDACVSGIMRKKTIQLCKKLKIPLIESSISPALLVKAEEVFLTNAISGLVWVASFEKKRYFHKLSDKLVAALNDLV